MAWYVWRLTPADNWMVYSETERMPDEQIPPEDRFYFYAEAQAEADRRNRARKSEGQGELGL